MAAEQQGDEAKRKGIPWWGWAVALFLICGTLILFVPELRATFGNFLIGAFHLMFTPIILESTMMIGGFFLVVVVVSILRMKEDKDEWVYLSQVDPDTVDEELPKPLQKRIEGAVFTEGHSEIETPDDVNLGDDRGIHPPRDVRRGDRGIDEASRTRRGPVDKAAAVDAGFSLQG